MTSIVAAPHNDLLHPNHNRKPMPNPTQQIIDQLKQPLDVSRVQKRPGAGSKQLSYLETYDVINHLNAVFGFNGWDCETVMVKLTPNETAPLGFVAVVRLRVQFGEQTVERSGTGWGTVTKGNFELGAKEAESDALKRASRTLGDQFGNSLYDKEAVEHSGQQRAHLATVAQLQECEALRQKAVKFGCRTSKGNEPRKAEEGATEEKVLALTASYREYIQQHGDKGGTAPTDRIGALLDRDTDTGGFSRFLAAIEANGLPFSTDADLVAFEDAATPKTNMPVVAENQSDEDWNGWAAMVENNDLTWGAT